MLPLLLLVEQAEAHRVLQICNACRYCEGHCAVFPAMARRLEFPAADLHYLANLCHQCGACLHACQYASPHEFAVNVPRALAAVRNTTYADYAWPQALAGLYQRRGVSLAAALVVALTLFLVLMLARTNNVWHEPMAGDFYRIFPHGLMVGLFAPVFAFALLALGIGVARFWRAAPPGSPGPAGAGAAADAAHQALSLQHLGGGHGLGCPNDSDAFSLARRRAHHFTFYGFMLCFAATCVATLYHYAWGWQAPYALSSLPVLLGTAGGVAMVLGTTAQAWLLHRRDAQLSLAGQPKLDQAFIALLFAVASTGLALLGLRHTSAMGLLLAVHLACVMALFLTLPYGKFAHGPYRAAALLKWAVEKRQPNRVGLSGD